MHSTSLYRGVPFIRGLSRSGSPQGMNKQQLEIFKKKTRVLSILLSTALFETTRESTSCLTTLIQNVTENHNIIEDNWLLWLRNMVSKVRIAQGEGSMMA